MEISSKKYHPNWVSSYHSFDDVNSLFSISYPTHLYHQTCASFSFTLTHGRLIYSWIAHTRLISYPHGWMLINTYILSPKLSLMETMSWSQFSGEWHLGIYSWSFIVVTIMFAFAFILLGCLSNHNPNIDPWNRCFMNDGAIHSLMLTILTPLRPSKYGVSIYSRMKYIRCKYKSEHCQSNILLVKCYNKLKNMGWISSEITRIRVKRRSLRISKSSIAWASHKLWDSSNMAFSAAQHWPHPSW